MNAPDPKANTTTEAYLAYKAGYLEESELKPVLYEPYLHFDGWLAYWAGLTNEYPLDKNGDPEMLTDEEALVAYLAGVTDTYPEEIKDPYDVRIVGYLRHLASIRWPEPDYPVNNEEFYLSTMEPTHTSNSEPSADIELDTAEGKIIGVEAYGDTYQQTYSGKNLLRNTFNSPSTVSGVTFTKNPDGTITANGTATEGLNFYPNGNVFYPIAEGTYTLSDGLPNPTSTTYFTYIDTNTSLPNYIYFNTAEGTVTRTLPEGVTIKPRIVIRQGQTLDNVVFKPMLEQGSTATSFEPYVGGIPAPNPDYPQDVQFVTGEQTVKVTGRNLLRLVQLNSPSQGITTTVNSDGSITVSGTASSSWATLTSASTDVTLSSGGTYTFSIDKELPVSIGLISSGVTRQDFNIVPNRTSVTATADYDNTALSLYMFGLTPNQTYDFTIYPQFEKGSSVTTYEPFQSQTYTVYLGSIELCKIGNYQDKIFNNDPNEDWYDPDLEDNAWYVHKEVGTYTFDGTESWIAAAVGDGYVFYTTVITDYAIQNNVPISKYFSGASNVSSYSATPSNSITFISISGQTTPRFYVRYNNNFSSANELKTFMEENNPIVYYALATATDTKITDTDLITDLNALAGADTYNEKTFIGVTATDPNLPALLKVEAYKY